MFALVVLATVFLSGVGASVQCKRDFRKAGCFKRNAGLLTDLIITDLDPTHKKFGTEIDWGSFHASIHSLACRCRDKALNGGYSYFSIGFYGDCYAGKDKEALEKKIILPGAHASNECVNGDYGDCEMDDKKECVGIEDNEYIYEILQATVKTVAPPTQPPVLVTMVPPSHSGFNEALSGKWSLAYTNGHKNVYEISSEGKLTQISGRTTTLEKSDNQVTFPTSKGWYKAKGAHRATTWEYIRVKDDGTLEVQHFCTDYCYGTYKNVKNYCCWATGKKTFNKGVVGKWKVSYSNGHQNIYVITKVGRLTQKNGRSSSLESSDNQVVFPTLQGWYKSKGTHRDTTWEYIRLKEDGTLEVQHFCTDYCHGTYKNVKNYCCVGSGDKEFSKVLVGTWDMKYPNGHINKYIISDQGRLTQNSGRSTYLETSDNQVQFPTSQGWYKFTGGHRDATWEYIRVASDGTLEVQHFCSDLCHTATKYKTLPNYCCVGTGRRELNLALIGKWSLTYTNGHRNVYVISSQGKLTQLSGRTTTLEKSDNQVTFPTSEGWYKSKGGHRATTWEYIRVKDDGDLEVHHFFSDYVGSTYKNLKNYCCSAAGTKLSGLTGSWTVAYTNGYKDDSEISSIGKMTSNALSKNSFLEPTDDSVNFPASQGWFKVSKLHRDTTWEYIRLKVDGTLEVQHFCTDYCHGRYKNLNNYCCVGSGKKIHHTKPVCEGNTLHLRCPGSAKLSITHVNYGRTDSTTCSGKSWYRTACHSSQASKSKVLKDCNGKTTCSIPATNGHFGDPCWLTYKYLVARYQCN